LEIKIDVVHLALKILLLYHEMRFSAAGINGHFNAGKLLFCWDNQITPTKE